MDCNLTANTSTLIQLVVVTLINGSALLLTLVSLPLILFVRGIDSSLREIFISFQIANLVGGALITHDALCSLCDSESVKLASISILLTLGHLAKLLAAEYTILTSSLKKGSSETFGGLIFTCWLLSVSVGLLKSNLPHEKYQNPAYVVFSCGVLATLVVIIFIYVKIIHKNQGARRRLIAIRTALLDRKHRKHTSPKSYEELKHVPFVFLSYIVFTSPWIVQKLYEGTTAMEPPHYVVFANLLLFALCFYIPSLGAINLCMKLKSGRVIPCDEEVENAARPDIVGSFLDRITNAFDSDVRDDNEIFNYSYSHS